MAKTDERTMPGTIDDRHLDYKTIAIGVCSVLMVLCSVIVASAQEGLKELKADKADKAVVDEQFKNMQNQLNNIQKSVDEVKIKIDNRDRELLEAIKSLKG